MSFYWDVNNYPRIISVLLRVRECLLCVSVPHIIRLWHMLWHVICYLCDIDQRPGMVAKMDSRCSAKHENAVITENRWPRHSLYWFPILIKHGINVHVLTFIVTLRLSLLFRDVNVSSGGYKHILQGCQCTGLSWVQIVTVVKSRFFPKGKAATHERREYSVCIDRSGTRRGWVLFSFGWMAFLIDRTLAFCPLDVCVCTHSSMLYQHVKLPKCS